MATNASATNNADSSKSAESNQNDGSAATTPIRKNLLRSASLADLDGGDIPWKLSTPTEDVEIDPRAFQADNNEARTSASFLRTPILSNVGKKQIIEHKGENARMHGRQKSGISSRSSDEKSVSFGMKQDTIFDERHSENDDAYGQYLSTESPNRKQQKSVSLDQTTDNNNANTDVWRDNLREEPHQKQDSFPLLSIPKLSMEKQKVPVASVTSRGHRRHASFLSEISGSEDENDDETISEIPRDDSFKMMQLHSNRRLSLTVDMETGRSPSGSSMQFHRGQHAMRRVYSTDMMDAQSPRVRRKKAMSHNIDQLRRGLLNNVEHLKNSKKLLLPSSKSANDLRKLQNDGSDGNPIGDLKGAVIPKKQSQMQEQLSQSERVPSESLRFTDIKRRNRYNVEQVLNDKQSQNSRDEVQYRLSAITPIELRRRRYRNSLRLDAEISETITDGKTDIENGDTNNGGIDADGKWKRFLTSAGSFLTEVAIFVVSKSKQNISVGLVNKLLYWTFRKNFLVVFLVAACSFYLFTVIFAGLIYLIGKNNHKCIHVNGVDFGETRNQFVDAFALSWTTFSTVGYGLVYPGTSATMETSNIKKCTGIAIITTMEAFVGILFSGFWGAICFAKVTRVSSFAQVSFSDAIIVKYGTGVTGVVKNDEYEEGSSDEDSNLVSGNFYKQSKLPCPIFEFRIANRLHRHQGGEIIDASINIVASMDENQAARTVRNGEGMQPRIRRKGRRPRRLGSNTKNIARAQRNSSKSLYGDEDIVKELDIKQAQDSARAMIALYNSVAAQGEEGLSLTSSRRPSGVNGNETKEHRSNRSSFSDHATDSSRRNNTKPFPNQIFAKLSVESLEHPFFKRVWNVRHVLDARSPLLKQEAKELIRINKGHWPEELNNPTAVRASIHFDQILVSFSGTSNVDANSVYSQKAYNFEDVCVGFAFCNMLFRETNGNIGVDHKLLNDVKEQSGGGGEELLVREMTSSKRINPDIFIL